MNLSVREIKPADISLISAYWQSAEAAFLTAMGVDITKIPSEEVFSKTLAAQLNSPIETRKSCCIIWELNGQPVGHSNTNPTSFGNEAYMHLHLWKDESRQRGLGLELLKLTLPWFFGKLELKRLFSEPYALNAAPNKTLEKAGFEFRKEYITVPGYLNFEQAVNRWELTRERFNQLYPSAQAV